jgi:iron complex outermembrane receptor protein
VVDRTSAAVQVINSKQLRDRATISANLPNILGQAVPSLGLSSNTTSNIGQTLRGRTPLILIDGIPQSTPLRNGARDLRNIDPSVLERVEVIKGAPQPLSDSRLPTKDSRFPTALCQQLLIA